MTSVELYEPKHLKLWEHPNSYCGEVWPDYYVFLGRNRDSDVLEESNFEKGLEFIGGEKMEESDNDSDDLALVTIVREGHWAYGWVEWIAIHSSESEALRKADEVIGKLEDYPVLDEDDYSNKEQDGANEIWKNCYDYKERIKYIRDHRSQFEFQGFSDLIAQVKGKYFGGYASELIH